MDRSKEEFVSDMLCPFYPSICNSSSVQATLCLSRSPLQSWGATTMQGFLSPAVGRRRHEKKAVIPCILLCPAGYQSRAAAWGRGCVSVGLRKAAVLEQPCPPQGRQQHRARQCHFALQFLLSKSLKHGVKPFYVPFSDQLKGRVLQSWAEEPHSLKPLLQEILWHCRVWYPGVTFC